MSFPDHGNHTSPSFLEPIMRSYFTVKFELIKLLLNKVKLNNIN